MCSMPLQEVLTPEALTSSPVEFGAPIFPRTSLKEENNKEL